MEFINTYNSNRLSFVCETCGSLNGPSNVNFKKHNILECENCYEESYFPSNIENVYVLDSLYTGLLKLGYTTRHPKERLNEINSATGSVQWNLAFYYQTHTGYKLETILFEFFKNERLGNKEQLDLEIKYFLKSTYEEFYLVPNYIRKDLVVALPNVESKKIWRSQFYNELRKKNSAHKQTRPKNPRTKRKMTYNCPSCGAINPTPGSFIQTICNNCGCIIN